MDPKYTENKWTAEKMPKSEWKLSVTRVERVAANFDRTNLPRVTEFMSGPRRVTDFMNGQATEGSSPKGFW